MPKICVVGSINFDVVTSVDEYPEMGQTVIGKTIEEFHGGKGANQAVACAKQGKEVAMIGAVGDDDTGDHLIENLKNIDVNTEHIETLAETKSGQTTIILDGNADNVIIYVGGANTKLSPEVVKESMEQLKNCEILLTQLESPADAVLQAMKVAQSQEQLVIFDPAPPHNVSDEMLQYTDLILPNVHEAEFITGVKVVDESTAKEAAKILQEKGVSRGVITLGEGGSYVYEEDRITHIEAIEVDAIDTVGAGDCFAAAIASAMLDGEELVDAASYAGIVAALKVTKSGAQIGMPNREEIVAFGQSMNLPIYFTT